MNSSSTKLQNYKQGHLVLCPIVYNLAGCRNRPDSGGIEIEILLNRFQAESLFQDQREGKIRLISHCLIPKEELQKLKIITG